MTGRVVKTHPLNSERKFSKKDFSEWISLMAGKQSSPGFEMAFIGGKWYSKEDIMRIIEKF